MNKYTNYDYLVIADTFFFVYNYTQLLPNIPVCIFLRISTSRSRSSSRLASCFKYWESTLSSRADTGRDTNHHILRGNYSMKITVIGATGATGRKVIERALELGHEVVAVARRPEVISPKSRLSVRQGDVLDMPSIAKALDDTDAVISCIGPTRNFSPGTVMSEGISNILKNFSPGTIMSEGISNILAACQSAGVKHFVMQSGIGLSDGKELSAFNRWAIHISGCIFSKAVEDKAIGERAVQRSDLDWIIVRPAALSDVSATSKYTAGPSIHIAPLLPLSFVDCADCLVRAATSEPTWVRKIVNVGR